MLTVLRPLPFRMLPPRRLALLACLLVSAAMWPPAAHAQSNGQNNGQSNSQNNPPPSGPSLVRASNSVASQMNAPAAAAADGGLGQNPTQSPTAPQPRNPQGGVVANGVPNSGFPGLGDSAPPQTDASGNVPGSTAASVPNDPNAPVNTTPRPANTRETTEALQAALAEEAARAAEAAAAADATKAQAEAKMNDRAYNSAVKGLFPMSPDQINGVMKKMEDTQNASVPPSYGQPKPDVAVNTINLDPGVAPPEIQVAVGYVSTLTILDATGQPWPIIDIGVGGNFDIPAPEANGHIIRITPMTRYGYGNLSVRLKDLATPITFRLSAGGDIVHYRYDARIPRNGPNAKVSLIERQKITAGDDVIMSVLDNAIPSGAKKLKVSGTDRRTAAYKVSDRTFVRTPLSMISPSWDASVSSADGMTVYEVGDTPVVLLSDAGQLVRVRLTEQATQ